MVEPLVIPFVVVVRDALADGATPRALADQAHALEAGVLEGAHEALRVGVQVRRAGGASDGGDIGRGERVVHGRPEERVAVMDEDPDGLQASVLGIGGVPHELGPHGPSGSALMPAICTRRLARGIRPSTVKRVRPRGVQPSTVKQSAAASTSRWAARHSRQVLRVVRSGAGSRPRSLRTLARGPRAT